MRVQEQRLGGHARYWVLVLVASLGLGCSSQGRHFSHMQESLSIEIMPDTSKQFVYRLLLPQGAPVDAHLAQRGAPGGPGLRPNRRHYQQLRENVDVALERTGYCREGYLELDRRLAMHTLWLRGECREGASPEDIARFGEQRSLPLAP